MLLWDPRHSPRGPAGRGGPRCLSVRVLPVENETAVRGTAGTAAGPGSVCPHHRPPAPAPHSPLDRGALGPQESHAVPEGHPSRGGRWGPGLPEIRAMGQSGRQPETGGGSGAGLETGLQRSGVLWGHVGSSDPRLPSQRPGAPRETAQRERPRPRRREHRTI